MSAFSSEAELAKVVVEYLRESGYSVYQEVQTQYGVIDIIGERGGVCLAVEAKLSFNFTVIHQAMLRRPAVAFSAVAVPAIKNYHAREAGLKLCEYEGIGVLTVADPEEHRLDKWCFPVKVALEPRFHRYGHKHRLASQLRPEQMEFAQAGTNRGYWTPFKITRENVVKHVKKSPGCTPKELISAITHHWAAKGAPRNVVECAERGLFPGVEIRREGKSITFWPKEETVHV